ncbi:hypothetical protein PVAND_005706 [Polypedilum vanderplanki]|uniref:Transporter n=1 Tax=Polypedilum vanderplanki TaxID=319348 RepID=A0A9J6C0Z1_POLVA|nr:hypothetical protein PVAND_005706 [Polypedilum vanderplanki]
MTNENSLDAAESTTNLTSPAKGKIQQINHSEKKGNGEDLAADGYDTWNDERKEEEKESNPLNPNGSSNAKDKDREERALIVSLTQGRPRETWNQKVEFLLAVIGFAVDLGNVWRFPYICYQNGGGAFLIPYVIMLLLGGLPLFYMELALGQFHRCGCLSIWNRICPALKGVGMAICIIDIYMGMYYNTIIGWAVYYFFASFTSELPWEKCGKPWNTEACLSVDIPTNLTNTTTPAREYFERNVLEQYKSNGLEYMGPVKPSLALCVFGVFVLVYFSLWKGVKSTGKAVWITALAPYFVLVVLLIRGVTLDGAGEGIRYYLTPEWEKLKNTKVWIDAASQIFFSLGPGFGTLLALSSYNKFNNNCYRDALLTSSINCLTSFLAGFVIFSVLGYMAKIQNVDIDKVGLEGPGLVFIVYPEAISLMGGSTFFSIIFFLMLITLGLDSTFGGLEAMITALCDEFPNFIGKRRKLFVLVLLAFIYICALPTMTYGGVYLVNFLNVYGPGLAILFVVFVESAGVFWFYGVDKFSDDIEQMLGQKPSLYWRICWRYISPTFLFVILIFSILNNEDMLGEEYYYPEWAIPLGWLLTLSSVICIPLYMIYKFDISRGSFKRKLRTMFKPEPLVPLSGQISTMISTV